MAAIIRAYCPTGTKTDAIRNLMLSHGGYTTFSAMGHWIGSNPMKEVAEQVVVYECIVDGNMPARQLDYAGRAFLNDNPKEQAFLGIVQSGYGVETIYIERN